MSTACRSSEVDPATVPYFSMIIVPGSGPTPDSAGRFAHRAIPLPLDGRTRRSASPVRELLVVGLGPGPDRWLTPEVVGRPGRGRSRRRLRARTSTGCRSARDCSGTRRGNTVEVDRARFALDLARSGERVAVVSGGDAGVFGMASAVFEAAETTATPGSPIAVLPGVTAAQAVAARAGAPLGGDYAVLSLSDRLKPWSVIEGGCGPSLRPTWCWPSTTRPHQSGASRSAHARRDPARGPRPRDPGRRRPRRRPTG